MVIALWLLACATTPLAPPAPPAPLEVAPAPVQASWQVRTLSSGLRVQLHPDDRHPLVEIVVLGASVSPATGLRRELDGGTHLVVAPDQLPAALDALFVALADSDAHPRHVTVLLHGQLQPVPTLLALEQRLGPWRPLGPVPPAPPRPDPQPRQPARSGSDLVLLHARDLVTQP